MDSEGSSKTLEVVDGSEVRTLEEKDAMDNSGATVFQEQNINAPKENVAGINQSKMEFEVVEGANETKVDDNAIQQEYPECQIFDEADTSDKQDLVTEKNEVQETSFIIVNPVASSEASTSQDNTPTSSNDNESCPSRSDQGEVKRCMSKGQANGDSGISLEKSGNSSDEDSSKRQRLYESACGRSKSEGENLAENASKFHKLKSKVKKRNYRFKTNVAGDNSDSCVEPAANESDTARDTGDASTARETEDLELKLEFSDDSDDPVDVDSNDWPPISEDEMEEREQTPPCLKKEKPKPNWFVVPELFKREIGINPYLRHRYYGSLHVVEHFELMYKMNEHQGCVNALNFNQKGNLLASGSDDLAVVIWDWALGKKHHSFDSGHRSNLFQAKWLPFDVEYLLATCARDGQVRLLDIRRGTSRKIATHHAPTHKLAVHPDSPHVIISVGEDAKVLSIDIRENKPSKLLVVKDSFSDVQLYSVHCNPLNGNEFCVGGRSQTVWVYDQRKVSTPVHKLCPDHLTRNKHAHVTCAVYNHNGTEVLASYNDEDIYLFDTVSYKTGEFAHRYQGHRNSATVKGVNFFGPKSEFVISGSDCGNIFIWDKNTEAIVNLMPGDEQGVVNCLEPHPHIPVLATSGLDFDVKIWVPSCENAPDLKNLNNCIEANTQNRAEDRANEPEQFYGHMLWILLRHVRHTERVRDLNARRGFEDRNRDDDDDDDDDYNADDLSDDNDSSDNSDSQSEGDGDDTRRLRCRPS